MSYTYPIIADHATYVMAHANNLGPWEFVRNCSYVAIVLLIVIIVLCVLTSLLEIFPMQERDVTRDILLVLGYILIRTGIRKIHSNLAQRFLFFSLLWSSLLLPYVINGQISSLVTKPHRGYEPKEVTKLKDYRFILYSEFRYVSLSIQNCYS